MEELDYEVNAIYHWNLDYIVLEVVNSSVFILLILYRKVVLDSLHWIPHSPQKSELFADILVRSN